MMDWLFEHVVLRLFRRQLDAWKRALFVSGAREAFKSEMIIDDRLHDLRRIAFAAGRQC